MFYLTVTDTRTPRRTIEYVWTDATLRARLVRYFLNGAKSAHYDVTSWDMVKSIAD